MSNETMLELKEKLKANSIDYYMLADRLLFTPSLCGRLLGLFLDDRNILFVPNLNPSSDDPDAWNKGGHRTWIAPEGGEYGFFFTANAKHWHVPPALDSEYSLSLLEEDNIIEMACEANLFNNNGERFRVLLKRRYEAMECSCDHVSFSFCHSIRSLAGSIPLGRIALWSILQLCPSGWVYVIFRDGYGDCIWTDAYYEAIPKERVLNKGFGLEILMQEGQRYKLGFGGSIEGIVAYVFNRDEDWYLISKTFPMKPDALYIDRPLSRQDENGHPIQIYNHSGKGDKAFIELEVHSPSISIGKSMSYGFRINVNAWKGTRDSIVEIARFILHPDFRMPLI